MTAVFHADLAWTGDALEASVAIEVREGVVASVTPGAAPAAGAHRLRGLTLPGLANAHSHAFHRALRGEAHGEGDFWSWRRRMYEVAGSLDPDLYLELASAVYAEMALAGVTAVGEFHYLHHDPAGRLYADPNATGHSLLEAGRAAGVRVTLLDSLYLRAGFGDARLEGAQVRFSDGDWEAWAARVSRLEAGPGGRIGAAIHSVRAVDSESAGAAAAWARARGMPIHVHVSEQPAENEDCVRATGMTPTVLLDSVGALGPDLTAVHAVHLDDADKEVLGRRGVTVCACRTTERDLGDGVVRARELVDAGVRLCLGSDSNAVIDILEEARAVELDQRACLGRRGLHSPGRLLAAATRDGTAALGWNAGRIAPGAIADLVAVRLDSVRTAGARDPLAAAVFAASAADVTDVIAGGRVIVTEGHHLTVPDPAARLAAAVARL